MHGVSMWAGEGQNLRGQKMEKLFKLSTHKTAVKTEVLAGVTSFFAAVYTIIVNSSILSDGGKDAQTLVIAIVLSSVIGCLFAAFIANAPVVIIPGIGINALFTYTIIKGMGFSFSEALTCVVFSGLMLLVLVITPLAKILIESIPNSIKSSITVGIGLFITFLGLQKSGLVVSSPSTFLTLGKLSSPAVVAFIITMIITLVLFIKDVKGNFLISIVLGTLVAIALGTVDLSSFKLTMPNFAAYKDIFFALNIKALFSIKFWIATFSLTIVLVFENIGSLHGQLGAMIKQSDKIEKGLKAIGLSSVCFGLFGCCPPACSVEGAAGIAAGGRTGLTSLTAGLMFLISLFFIPVINIIPNSAIAPILIIIGGLMIEHISAINFKSFSDSFPAFVILVFVPLTFSIVDGVAFGFITYTICKIASKKYKDISIPMWVVSFIFLVYLLLKVI